MRRALVHNWEDLLVRAHTPPVARDPRVPFNRGGVITREREIRRMLDALLRPLPVQARGAAMVSRLLSDGTGPLYDHRRSVDLGAAITEAIDQLDPSVSLAHSA